jgi:hypothetical protein
MKKLAMLSIWLALPLAGCKTVTTVPPPWAPNQAIATAGEIISAANNAVVQYEADVKAGFVPSPALNSAMSDIQQGLAIAQPAFNEWEAAARANSTAAEPSALPAAIQRISTDLGKLPSTN